MANWATTASSTSDHYYCSRWIFTILILLHTSTTRVHVGIPIPRSDCGTIHQRAPSNDRKQRDGPDTPAPRDRTTIVPTPTPRCRCFRASARAIQTAVHAHLTADVHIRCSSGIQQMTPIHLLARESVSWRKRPVAAAVSLACPTTPNEHLKMLQLQVAISHAQNPHVTHTTHLHATSVLLLCRVGAIGTWTATAPRRPLLSQTMRLCFLNIMWGATKKT